MAINPDEIELLLDRAARGLREVSAPNEPPADVVEKVRLMGASAAPQHSELIDRAPFTRAAAPWIRGVNVMRPRNLAAVAAAGLLIVFGTEWLSSQSNSNFAFAEVQEQVGRTKSVQYSETLIQATPDGKPLPTLVGHVKILGNRLMRNEMSTKSDGEP